MVDQGKALADIEQSEDKSSIISQFVQAALGCPGRFVTYGIVTFGLGQALYKVLLSRGPETLGQENGLVEQLQVGLAMSASIAFFFAAFKSTYGKAGLIFCGALAGYAAGRECDQWLENYLFNDAYKYLIGMPLLIFTLVATWIHRRTVLSDSVTLSRTPAITMFGIAGVYLCAVCQIFDRPDFWAGISDHPNAIVTKMLVEEFSEVFGYLLIAFAGVEAVLDSLTRYSFEGHESLETRASGLPEQE